MATNKDNGLVLLADRPVRADMSYVCTVADGKAQVNRVTVHAADFTGNSRSD